MKLNPTRQAIACIAVLAFVAASGAYAQDGAAAASASVAAPAVPAEAAPAVPAATPAVPAAPTVAMLNPVDPVPEGKAQIIFFRPSRMVGMAVSFSIREGDTGIGKPTNGSYFVHVTDPGVKEYNISFEAKDTLRLEVEAGETYYVIEGIAMGVVGARPNLTPSTEEAFQEKKLKVTKAVATDRNH